MLGGEAGEQIDDTCVESTLEVLIRSIHAVKFQVLLAALNHGLFDQLVKGNLAVLLVRVVLNLFLVFGIFSDIAGDAEDFHPLFVGGGFPASEKALVKGGDDLVERILLGVVAAIAARVGVLWIDFGILLVQRDRIIQPAPL